MPGYTSTNAALAVMKIVAANGLDYLMPNWAMGNIVNRNYESALAQSGDTVNVAIPPSFVANQIAEGGSVQLQNPNLGNAQIVLNRHAETTFTIPDVTKAIVTPDLLNMLVNPAMVAVATQIEQDILNLYPLFTVNTATGAASTMDEARIDSAETTLFNQYVPKQQKKYLVVSGTAFGQLRQLPRFTEFQTTGFAAGGPNGTNGIQTADMAGAGPLGASGVIKDFLVFRSQLVTKSGGTTYNMAFAKDAIGLVVRRMSGAMPGTGAITTYAEMGNFGLRLTMSYVPGQLSQQITVDCLYGVAVLRNSFGVQVQSN